MITSFREIDAVVVVHEGIPGHYNQSLGIDERIHELTGAKIYEAKVPNFEKLQRLLKVRKNLENLPTLSPDELKKWLQRAEGLQCFEEITEWFLKTGLCPEKSLIISAGSRVGAYTYAISRLLSCRSASIMLNKYLKSSNYDYVIMPEHKIYLILAETKGSLKPDNVFALHGAANRISSERLLNEGQRILQEYPEKRKKKWAIFLGGESAIQKLPSPFVQPVLEKIWEDAAKEEADIYLTTSRRTDRVVEQMIIDVFSKRENTGLIWLASEKEGNPVPGFLGIAELVYCSEDSVTMIWESLTAKKNVVLIPCQPAETRRRILLRTLRKKLGLLKGRPIRKVDDFRKKYDRIRAENWAKYIDETEKNFRAPDFDETLVISRWIVDNWH